MLTGDDLTIQLFVGASAVAVLGVAVTQAGWTHRWFVRSLFVIAAALALLAVYWKPIRDAHPEIGPVASDVAGSSISWFTLLIVGFGIVFFLDLLARVGWFAKAQPKQADTTAQTAILSGEAVKPAKERVFVTVAPEYLMAFYDDRTSIQGDQLAKNYIGKWIRVSGEVGNATSKWIILVTLRLTDHKHITLTFDDSWMERVSLFISGQKITTIGEISQISDTSIVLSHCEVVEPI